jgi:hypothetical protein
VNGKVLLAFISISLFSTAYAFDLNVSFPQGIPDKLDFAYGISTGDCSSPSSIKCKFTQSQIGGLGSAYIVKYLQSINSFFKTMTPVADKFHKPTNYITMKVTGKTGRCSIDVLGKTRISVMMNKDGVCVIK